ncbi:sodium:glutamate symporter [Synergistales bacterium]|nr:sodium:glutamate symporter [Synergistales bacterium]
MTSLLADYSILFVFLIIGFVIRDRLVIFQRLYIPASVIGGSLMLILGPQMLNLIVIPDSFSSMSSVLINVAITSLVFGVTVTKSKAMNYLDYGLILLGACGMQVFVGTAIGVAFSKVYTDLPPQWGAMAYFAFYGGHGNSATVGKTFEAMGVPGLSDVGLVLSTFGLLTAIIIGTVLINIFVRKGYAKFVKVVAKNEGRESVRGGIPENKRKPIGLTRVVNDNCNNLAFQLALLLLCIWVGEQIFAKGLALVIPSITSYLPSMVRGIFGAIIVWSIMVKLNLGHLVDKGTVSSISGTALEVIILSAVATIRIDIVTQYIVPLLAITVICTIATAYGCFFMLKKCAVDEWFEKFCMMFGLCTGNVSTGLALVRMVDPNSQSTAPEAQGVASGSFLFFIRLFPGLIPVLAVTNGLWSVMGLGAFFMIFFWSLAWILLRKRVAAIR